jgi:hypothetical protein
MTEQAPVIIGALGGSGTRGVVLVLRRAGWWMGGRVDEQTQDSLPMRTFLAEWFEPLLDFPDIPPPINEQARAAFEHAIAAHRAGIPAPAAPWGWKNPRNMWLLPFYASVYPRLKFIHVVRDGRDMSLSNNLFLLETHGDRLLGSGWRDDPEAAQLQLWTMGNSRARALAERQAGIDYFLLRYEDFCTNSRETLSRLFAFLGAAQSLVEEAVKEIQPSAGIGRWRTGGRAIPASAAIRQALETFGY